MQCMPGTMETAPADGGQAPADGGLSNEDPRREAPTSAPACCSGSQWSSWVSFHVYAHQNYRSFDVTVDVTDRVEAVKTLIMDLIGDLRPKGEPAFCFEISPGEWHDLPGHPPLSMLFKVNTRVNMYILWDKASS